MRQAVCPVDLRAGRRSVSAIDRVGKAVVAGGIELDLVAVGAALPTIGPNELAPRRVVVNDGAAKESSTGESRIELEPSGMESMHYQTHQSVLDNLAARILTIRDSL